MQMTSTALTMTGNSLILLLFALGSNAALQVFSKMNRDMEKSPKDKSTPLQQLITMMMMVTAVQLTLSMMMLQTTLLQTHLAKLNTFQQLEQQPTALTSNQNAMTTTMPQIITEMTISTNTAKVENDTHASAGTLTYDETNVTNNPNTIITSKQLQHN